MTDMPAHTVYLTPEGGLPLGNYPEKNLVQYTRTDIHEAAVAELVEVLNKCKAAMEKVYSQSDAGFLVMYEIEDAKAAIAKHGKQP